MSELAQAEVKAKSQEELFHQLLSQMPDNMRLYQELGNKLMPLQDKLALRKSRIANIDINVPPYSHPVETAYSGLGVYVMERRLQAVRTEMYELDSAGDWIQFLELTGRKVRVEPLGGRGINTISNDTFVSSSKKPKSGILERLSLTPSDGGFIEFRGKILGDSKRTAHPLFDRFEYKPQFKIEFI